MWSSSKCLHPKARLCAFPQVSELSLKFRVRPHNRFINIQLDALGDSTDKQMETEQYSCLSGKLDWYLIIALLSPRTKILEVAKRPPISGAASWSRALLTVLQKKKKYILPITLKMVLGF